MYKAYKGLWHSLRLINFARAPEILSYFTTTGEKREKKTKK